MCLLTGGADRILKICRKHTSTQFTWVETIEAIERGAILKGVKIVNEIKIVVSAGSLEPGMELSEPTETLCT